MSNTKRKLALPIIGALASVLLLGGFDGCNIYIQPFNEPEVQPEPAPNPEPSPDPRPEPQPEPGPDVECRSDDDCRDGSVCYFFDDDNCQGDPEPNCDTNADGQEDCTSIAIPCGGIGYCIEEEPRCEEDCYDNYEAILRECLEAAPSGGPIDEECFRIAEDFLGQCVDSCNGNPPPPPQCEDACFEDFDLLLVECLESGVDADQCFRYAEENLEYCLMDCDIVEPPQCEEGCFQQFDEILRDCEIIGDDECFRFAEENLEYCLMECSEPPPPPYCEDDCIINFEALLQDCMGGNEDPNDPTGIRPEPQDCERFAEEFLGQCLDSCQPNNGCESDADCGDDGYCEIVERCFDGGPTPDCDTGNDNPNGEPCTEPGYPVECGYEGICVYDTPPPPGCSSDDECGPGAYCEIIEWCNAGEPTQPGCEDGIGPNGEPCDNDGDVMPPDCGFEGICVEDDTRPSEGCSVGDECGPGYRCEIVEWCDGGGPTEPGCEDGTGPNGEPCADDGDVAPDCHYEGICVEDDALPPCTSDDQCGEDSYCEVQEYCFFNCEAGDPDCCFEEGQCVPNDDTACIQIEVAAANPENGNCEVFPTPCDVPDGWVPCEGDVDLPLP